VKIAITRAQVRMLAEGIADPLPDSAPLPEDLRPQTELTLTQVRQITELVE
jgi:hypothetical protein